MRHYLDCEFNGFKGELMSLSLVSEHGDALYLINSDVDYDAVDPWVSANVVPLLLKHESRPGMWAWSGQLQWFGQQIARFLNDESDGEFIIITDWPDDIKYFCECLITGPGEMINIPGIKFEMHRVDAYPTTLPGAIQHNAYWDAMALRHKLQGGASLSPAQQAHVEKGWPL